MIYSQFTIYSSADVGAPILNGTSGSMVELLDACLVNGYGSKSPAGWTKPLPNVNNKGCYQLPSGSKQILFVNDSAPVSSSGQGTRDAYVCGCSSIFNLTGSSINHVLPSASAYFPDYTQTYYGVSSTYNPNSARLPQGTIAWRKSTSQDALGRPWVMYADPWTMYLFVNHGDNNENFWSFYCFGDIYSHSPTTDKKRCVIGGRAAAWASTVGYHDWTDMMTCCAFGSSYSSWAAQSWTGIGGPVVVNKVGPLSLTSNHSGYHLLNGSAYTMCYPLAGESGLGNKIDNTFHIHPVLVGESGTSSIRGRFRGLYCCPISSQYVSAGFRMNGGNEYKNKTFEIISPGIHDGHWWVEITPTVETNDES